MKFVNQFPIKCVYACSYHEVVRVLLVALKRNTLQQPTPPPLPAVVGGVIAMRKQTYLKQLAVGDGSDHHGEVTS